MHIKYLRAAGLFTGLVLVVLGASFIWFTLNINQPSTVPIQQADAIVVVTGKSSRIGEAMNLLAQGKGQKLLISGVNRTTSKQSLNRRFSRHSHLFACCVELDHLAQNTRGNASQSAQWVRRNNIKSLILVTSSYHMPRAFAEFSSAMPGIKLQGRPIVTQNIYIDRWWAYPGTAKLLAIEYAKYLLALLRIHILRS
jgi:uncharacterized SAM-binding protein YcdF (DUF218 family)